MDLNLLKKVDLDLSIDIESFDKRHARMDSASFEVALHEGRLNISPATLVYPKGTLQLHGHVDAREQPLVSFKAFGKDINPWLALDMEQAETSRVLDPELDIDGQITSSGVSAHELAANMQGDMYLKMNDGRMSKELLDKLFVDLVGWTISKATGQEYVAVHCGVADYTINQGVISTNALFLETRNIAIAGNGSVDLGKERIDYVFLPKKKSRVIQQAEPVEIKGPLHNPTVEVLPWKSAVTTYGSMFFAPYVFAGITAYDLLRDAMNIDSQKSPCLEYERQNNRE